MANKFIIPLPPVVGVVPGQTATLDIPIGPRYHVLWLQGTVKRTGVAPALTDIFGDLRVKINGKPVRTHTAAQINAINTLMGADFAYTVSGGSGGGGAPQAGDTCTFLLPLFLAEPWRKQYAETALMAWPTSWPGGSKLATFQLEMDTPNNANTSLHAITAFCESDNVLGMVDSKGNPVFTLSKWNRLAVPYTGGGDVYIVTLPKREIYQQISLFTNTDTITHLKVKVDGTIITDADKSVNDVTLVAREMNLAALSTTRFDRVFDYDDDPKSALLMQFGGASVQDFQVIPTLSGGLGNPLIITVLYQTYGLPDL